jgi:hypothetical protein
MITGVALRFRSWRSTSKPSSAGSMTSRMISSYPPSIARANPAEAIVYRVDVEFVAGEIIAHERTEIRVVFYQQDRSWRVRHKVAISHLYRKAAPVGGFFTKLKALVAAECLLL